MYMNDVKSVGMDIHQIKKAIESTKEAQVKEMRKHTDAVPAAPSGKIVQNRR